MGSECIFIKNSAFATNHSFSSASAIRNNLFRTSTIPVHFVGVKDSVSASAPLDFVVLEAFRIHVLPSKGTNS